jgi:hypothetical protein
MNDNKKLRVFGVSALSKLKWCVIILKTASLAKGFSLGIPYGAV